MIMHLDEADVRSVLSWDELIVVMEKALAAFSTGRVLQPVRNMLTIEEGKRYLGIMPAVAEDAMGLKLVSFYSVQCGYCRSHAYGDGAVVPPGDGRATRRDGWPSHHRNAHGRCLCGGDQTSGVA